MVKKKDKIKTDIDALLKAGSPSGIPQGIKPMLAG